MLIQTNPFSPLKKYRVWVEMYFIYENPGCWLKTVNKRWTAGIFEGPTTASTKSIIFFFSLNYFTESDQICILPTHNPILNLICIWKKTWRFINQERQFYMIRVRRKTWSYSLTGLMFLTLELTIFLQVKWRSMNLTLPKCETIIDWSMNLKWREWRVWTGWTLSFGLRTFKPRSWSSVLRIDCQIFSLIY